MCPSLQVGEQLVAYRVSQFIRDFDKSDGQLATVHANLTVLLVLFYLKKKTLNFLMQRQRARLSVCLCRTIAPHPDTYPKIHSHFCLLVNLRYSLIFFLKLLTLYHPPSQKSLSIWLSSRSIFGFEHFIVCFVEKIYQVKFHDFGVQCCIFVLLFFFSIFM